MQLPQILSPAVYPHWHKNIEKLFAFRCLLLTLFLCPIRTYISPGKERKREKTILLLYVLSVSREAKKKKKKKKLPRFLLHLLYSFYQCFRSSREELNRNCVRRVALYGTIYNRNSLEMEEVSSANLEFSLLISDKFTKSIDKMMVSICRVTTMRIIETGLN